MFKTDWIKYLRVDTKKERSAVITACKITRTYIAQSPRGITCHHLLSKQLHSDTVDFGVLNEDIIPQLNTSYTLISIEAISTARQVCWNAKLIFFFFFSFHVSLCIKGLGVINPKHHKRNTTIRSDKQHNYTLVFETPDETEISNQK